MEGANNGTVNNNKESAIYQLFRKQRLNLKDIMYLI